MQIVIKADGSVLQEFMLKAEGTDVEIKLFEGENEHGSADAFFLLSDNDLPHSSMFMYTSTKGMVSCCEYILLASSQLNW